MENGSSTDSVHFTNEGDASASFANPLYDRTRTPRPSEATVTLDAGALNRATSTEDVDNSINSHTQTDGRKPAQNVYSQTKTGISGAGAHGQSEEEDPYAYIPAGAEYAKPVGARKPSLPPRYSSIDENAVYDSPKKREAEFDDPDYATAMEAKSAGLYESPPEARPVDSPPNYEASLYDSPAPVGNVHAMASLYDSPPTRYPARRDDAAPLPNKAPLDK